MIPICMSNSPTLGIARSMIQVKCVRMDEWVDVLNIAKNDSTRHVGPTPSPA